MNTLKCSRKPDPSGGERAALRLARPLWAACLGVALTVVALAGGGLAQSFETKPDSADPLLRVVPLERERVRPKRTPGLNIPAVAGKVTYVLHAYGEKAEGGARTPSVVLRIPAEFFRSIPEQPVEAFDIALLVQYPAMNRFPLDACRGSCQGKMMLVIQNRRMTIPTLPQSTINGFYHVMNLREQQPEPLVAYTAVTPWPGFSEAFDAVGLKITNPGARYTHYQIKRVGDEAVAFVRCNPKAPSPSCTARLALASHPHVGLKFTYSMDLVQQQDALQQSVLNFVEKLADGVIKHTAP